MGRLISSFKYAAAGLYHAFAKERNMKIHGVFTLLTVTFAAYLGIKPLEWMVLLLTIALVVGMELINTSIEALVDLVTEEYRRFAAIAKNVAAGAVLFCSLIAVIIGLIIFLPYLKS